MKKPCHSYVSASIFLFFIFYKRKKILRLCLVLGKCERKKIGRKNERKEKGKEMNIIFFSLVWLSMENSRRKKKKNSFSFVWLTTKKNVRKNGRKIKSTICLKWLSIC